MREFVLIDAEAGGAEVLGVGSSVLLRFDREAHTLGVLRSDFYGQEGQELTYRSDTWYHCEVASECSNPNPNANANAKPNPNPDPNPTPNPNPNPTHCEVASECCCDKLVGSTTLSACPPGATPPPWGWP